MSRAGLDFSPAADPVQGGDYDRLAPWYTLLERLVLGTRQQQCRLRLLDQLRQAERILIIGEGRGRTLRELLRLNPACHVDVLEPSPAMVRLATRHLSRVDPGLPRRVTFYQDRWQNWPDALAPTYDAMILPFLMDLFDAPQQRGLAERLRDLCRPGSCCLINDFSVLHRNSVLQRCLYAGARLTTGLKITELADYQAAMTQARWRLSQETGEGAKARFVSQIWVPA